MATTTGNSSRPAWDAWRRGWISRRQMEECVSTKGGKGISTLDALRESGLLDAGKLARLFGAEALPGAGIDEEISSEEPLQAGDIIGGRFRIFGIAEGGFGRVFFCKHGGTGESYALKAPRRCHLHEPALAGHFRAEAKRWMELGVHPHLVRAFGVEEHGGLLFLVLEYVDGGRTLADDLVGGTCNWRTTLSMACGLADALAYAEQFAGLIHGDIKPLNILLTPAGAAKLTDFGISYARLHEADENALAGTPGYLAPELLDGVPRSTATDIFAFGRTLWQSATGSLFLPEDPHATVEGVMLITPETPAPLAGLITACMHPDPSKRPLTFAMLRHDLQALHLQLTGDIFQPLELPPPGVTSEKEAARYAYNLSDSAMALGNHLQAAELARRAIEIDPGYWLGYDALGRALTALGNYHEAETSLLHAVRLQPEDPMLHALVADARFRAGSPDTARSALHQALALANKHSKTGELDFVSALIVQLLPPAHALAWLDEIVAAKPQASKAWVNRAAVLRLLNRPAEALECARQAANLNPGSAFAWAALSGALLDSGLGGEALEAIDRAMSFDNAQPSFYAQKCVILVSLGQGAEGQALFSIAIGKWPDSPELRSLM